MIEPRIAGLLLSRCCWSVLSRRVDEFDVLAQQLVDQSGQLDALGLGALGEVLADFGVEVDRQVEHRIFAVELAAFGIGEVVFSFHGLGAVGAVSGRVRTVAARGRWRGGRR